MRSLIAYSSRLGGALVAPRSTAAAMLADPSLEGAGRRDGAIGVGLFVLGSQVTRVAEGFAALDATRNWGGLLTAASAVGRAVLPPVLALFLLESLLGSDLARLRGVLLAPLLLIAVAGHLAISWGAVILGPSYLPEVLGIAWGALLALWMRRNLDSDKTTGEASA